MKPEIKAFNRWDVSAVKVGDPGLRNYITLEPKIAPKTGARYAGNRFHKSKIFIIERFINKIMVPGHKGKKHFKSSAHITGKSHNSYAVAENMLKIIEKRTKLNPIGVFVKAVENAAQREEIITIEYGGARYPKAVECAPQRRVDLVLRNFVQGSYVKAFNSKKAIQTCLADEVIAAYNLSPDSFALSKKLETERQADSSR